MGLIDEKVTAEPITTAPVPPAEFAKITPPRVLAASIVKIVFIVEVPIFPPKVIFPVPEIAEGVSAATINVVVVPVVNAKEFVKVSTVALCRVPPLPVMVPVPT